MQPGALTLALILIPTLTLALILIPTLTLDLIARGAHVARVGALQSTGARLHGGMGHGAYGMGHGAYGMGHGACDTGYREHGV